jgi:hypothetical protein
MGRDYRHRAGLMRGAGITITGGALRRWQIRDAAGRLLGRRWTLTGAERLALGAAHRKLQPEDAPSAEAAQAAPRQPAQGSKEARGGIEPV